MAPVVTGQVTCIVPAFNEGARIGAVLRALSGHPLIDRIIVVDDGSTDETLSVVRTVAGVEVMAQKANGGKTRALSLGLARATTPFVLLVDADLEGLSAAALSALISPVLVGHADLAISLRGNAPGLWHRIGLDYISGERIFRRDLVAGRLAELDRLPRFGFEVWLNAIIVDEELRIAVVPWPGVASPTKGRKYGLWSGLSSDIGMIADLVQSAGPLTLASQIRTMRRLRIRV